VVVPAQGEIEYGVKAIPAGGYVKIAGMNPFENDVPEGTTRGRTARSRRWHERSA
jgi:membrane-associated protease RseP (regulator of RpoE activity)